MLVELAISIAQAALVYAAAVLSLRLLPRVPKISLAHWQVVLALMVIMSGVQFSPALIRSTAPPPGAFTFSMIATSDMARATSHYTRWIGIVLCSGVALRLGWLFAGCFQLRRFRRRGTLMPAAGGARIVLSDDLSVPASYGIRRPVILLPHTWRALPDSVRHAALTHELVHLKRRDWLTHMAEELLRAVFWFHPVLPAVIRRLRLAREEVVDQASIAITQAPRDYLNALVAFVAPSPAVPVSSFSAARQLKERIETIQNESKMSKKALQTFLAATVILAATAALAVWSIPLRAADTTSDKVYRVGGDVTAPHIVERIEPGYTPEAKAAKVEGVVVLSMIVDKSGTVKDVRIVKHLDAGLDGKAIEAVKKWHFSPATMHGRPVSVKANIEVQFKLL